MRKRQELWSEIIMNQLASNKSTIFLSRAGYIFQDKVALYLLLIHFKQRDLKEFYIDYSLSLDQKSLDVRIVTAKSIEKVYEIKSGNTFKKSEDEILDAISDLHSYCYKKESNPQPFLLISHGFKPAISSIWDLLVLLRSYKILNSTKAKTSAKDLFKMMRSRKCAFKNEGDLYAFIRSIEVNDPFSDENTSASENDPLIEKFIRQEIDELFNDLKAGSTEPEYPTYTIYNDFIVLCTTKAGTKENILPVFIERLIWHISMRRLFSKHYSRPTDLDQRKNEVKDEAQKIFYEWWNSQLLVAGRKEASQGE